jgi:hypothetical protein
VADKVFEDYEGQLKEVFTYFAKSKSTDQFKDITIPIEEVINMFKKAGIVKGTDGKPANAPLKVEDLIASIERYFSPDQQLVAKQANEEAFKAYLDANPQLVPSKHVAQAQPGEGAEGDQPDAAAHEIDEAKVAEETAAAREKWLKQVLCEHLVYLRGVEVTYFEFKEIMLDVTINHLRYLLDPKSTGKVKPMLTRFLDEHFLRRLGALIRFSHNQAMISHSQSTNTQGPSNARLWPESDKDRVIRVKMEERRRIEEDERLKREEFERQQAEALKEQQEQEAARRKVASAEGGHHHQHHAHHEEDTSKVHGGEHNQDENEEVENAQQEDYGDEDAEEEY